MRARVIVMEPDDYEAWLADARARVARQSQRAQQPEQAPAQGGQGSTAPATEPAAPTP